MAEQYTTYQPTVGETVAIWVPDDELRARKHLDAYPDGLLVTITQTTAKAIAFDFSGETVWLPRGATQIVPLSPVRARTGELLRVGDRVKILGGVVSDRLLGRTGTVRTIDEQWRVYVTLDDPLPYESSAIVTFASERADASPLDLIAAANA